MAVESSLSTLRGDFFPRRSSSDYALTMLCSDYAKTNKLTGFLALTLVESDFGLLSGPSKEGVFIVYAFPGKGFLQRSGYFFQQLFRKSSLGPTEWLLIQLWN